MDWNRSSGHAALCSCSGRTEVSITAAYRAPAPATHMAGEGEAGLGCLPPWHGGVELDAKARARLRSLKYMALAFAEASTMQPTCKTTVAGPLLPWSAAEGSLKHRRYSTLSNCSKQAVLRLLLLTVALSICRRMPSSFQPCPDSPGVSDSPDGSWIGIMEGWVPCGAACGVVVKPTTIKLKRSDHQQQALRQQRPIPSRDGEGRKYIN